MRFVCFETHLEDFRYATNGGTAFLVRRKGTPFGITCRHVLRGFSIDDLVITDARTGRKGAGIPTNLRGENAGSDLDDICVIAFDEFEGQFFDGAYDLDGQLTASSEPANQVIATGFLKQKSRIDPPNIFAGLGFLEFRDAGVAQFDRALRRGLATYAKALPIKLPIASAAETALAPVGFQMASWSEPMPKTFSSGAPTCGCCGGLRR